MKVTLLGSTGFVGKHIVSKLLDAGHEVKTLVRSPGKLEEVAGRITVVDGDFFRNEDIDAATEGSEAVMSTIGPSTGEMSADFSDRCVLGMTHLIRTMEEQGAKRLIFMAGAGMPIPGEQLHLKRRLMATAIKVIARSAWAGKVAEMEIAFESDLDITVIRPPMIRNLGFGCLHADESIIGGVLVDVNQVADFMVKQLDSTEWIGKAPVVWTQRTRRR